MCFGHSSTPPHLTQNASSKFPKSVQNRLVKMLDFVSEQNNHIYMLPVWYCGCPVYTLVYKRGRMRDKVDLDVDTEQTWHVWEETALWDIKHLAVTSGEHWQPKDGGVVFTALHWMKRAASKARWDYKGVTTHPGAWQHGAHSPYDTVMGVSPHSTVLWFQIR